MEFSEVLDKSLYPVVAEHCGTYVKAMQETGRLLHRGFTNSEHHGRECFIGQSRPDRRPMDSTEVAQRAFDACLVKLGVAALRSNSVFCSADRGVAGSYGLTYVVFPFDDAKFAWSKNNFDLIIKPEHLSTIMPFTIPTECIDELRGIREAIRHALYAGIVDPKVDHNVDQYLEGGLRQDMDLVKQRIDAMLSGRGRESWSDFIGNFPIWTPNWFSWTKIHIPAKIYGALRDWRTKSVKQMIYDPHNINLQQFQKLYQIDTTNLPAALESDHAIWFTGKYVAFSAKLHSVELREKFNITLMGKPPTAT